MGDYSTSANNIVQQVQMTGGLWGMPAYWNGNLYVWPEQGKLSRFSLTNGLLSTSPVEVSPQTESAWYGSTPSISANGATAGIVWSIDWSQNPEVLYAHNATNVSQLLWSSAQNASRDAAGTNVKFVVPTIADGTVFVGALNQVSVYGLLNHGGKTQTITFNPITTHTAATTLALNASASSGLTVTFTSSTPGVCSVSGANASLLTSGTCTIVATQAGNSTYAAATPVSQSFTVNHAAQTITFGSIATQSAGTTISLGATATSGLAITYASSTTSTCTVSGSTASLLAAGTCTIAASQPGNSTYAAATPVSQSFTVTAAKGTFKLSASSGTVTVTPPVCFFIFCFGGSSATDKITITPTGGFTGTVNFNVTGLPTGVSAAFNPGSVTTSGSTTLTLTPSSSAAANRSTTLTINGSAGNSASASTTITLNY
jgi:hypothetical protein